SDADASRKNDEYEAYKKELDVRQQLLWVSDKERAIEELMSKYNISHVLAEQTYAYDKQLEKVEALRDAIKELGNSMMELGATNLVGFANDLGKAFQEGTNASDAFSGAVANMLRNLINAMPQLLLNVGLQLISKGNWQAGLAFIGASGLMSFVSGMIGDAQDQGKQDELDKLNKIQQQITDLIDAQRQQQEYYLVQKRRINANATSVNDAIITPKGIVHTSPQDYIIATKRPDQLMSGGNVSVIVNNYSSSNVTTSQETAEDGSKAIVVTVENIVKSGIASGKFDNAFNALNNRTKSRRVSS
ncbi:MAG: hypothetical protein FWF29_02375, partial [Treponema sp.]|nr:hypothetical protein [Treponema sp.]